MATLGSFPTQEEATICVAFLASSGLDAAVRINHESGATALGATSAGLVQIEVPDAQLEEAHKQLTYWLKLTGKNDAQDSLKKVQKTETQVPDPSGDREEATLLKWFRGLILVSIFSYALSFFGQPWFAIEMPAEVSNYVSSLALSETLWRLNYFLWDAHMILSVTGLVLCWFHLNYGKWLLLIVMGWALFSAVGMPPFVENGWGVLVFNIAWVTQTATLTLSYFSALKKRFR